MSDPELPPSRLMLDEEHDTSNYDTTYDDNIYACGTLAGHNVVVATCAPGMTGNINAGRVAGPMFKTFSGIRMAVLVGIGGGVPRAQPSDVHLGDVAVVWPSDGGPACVYYDSGRWHTDRQFEMLGTINRPDQVLLNALGKLASDHKMDRSTFHEHQERLLRSKHKRKFTFPGLDKDRLFQASYQHAGVYGDRCAGCDASQLVARPERTEEDAAGFLFHRGRIATGNAVIQDGERRDEIRGRCDGALCVEMEAAGVDVSRPCLVIRGISDYADSHKGDAWQSYAAGELLSKIPPSKVLSIAAQAPCLEQSKSHFLVPFGRNRGFVGREGILTQLLHTIAPMSQEDDCQRTVIEGLGGMGKTQVAIEAAYRAHEMYPDCSVFWVPAVDMTMFENAYREIGVKGIEEDKADVKALVKAALGRTDTGTWLLVVDNVDDVLLLTDGQLMQSLPFSRAGSILLTTRNHQAAVRFDIHGIVRLEEPDEPEARQLLHQGLEKRQISNLQHTTFGLHGIEHGHDDIQVRQVLPIEYEERVKLLSEDFHDQARYQNIQNPIALTWLISFEHIVWDKPLAAEYLQHVSYLAEKDTPAALFPPGDNERAASEAISTLDAYAFLQRRALDILVNDGPQHLPEDKPDRFDVHRLVRLVIRSWLREQGRENEQVTKTMSGLAQRLPWPTHQNRESWSGYLLHTQTVLELEGECVNKGVLWTVLLYTGEGTNLIGKYADAEVFCRKAVDVVSIVVGREHPDTLISMNNLELGKYSEAEEMHRETLGLKETVLGREHPDTLDSMNNLAELLSNMGIHNEIDQAN
ncbi:kinesin light chain 3 [Apiospora arundinis]